MITKTHVFRTVALLLTLLIFPSLSLGARAVSVKNDGVNIRSGPGTDFPVTMEVFKGYPLKVLETKGDWLKVTDFDNDSGWIYAPLVIPGSTVIANGKGDINMRSQPKSNSSKVATVARGVVMKRVSTKDDWVQVRHSQGTKGWIYAPLLWP
jgi:SH3-like domain-containing protein